MSKRIKIGLSDPEAQLTWKHIEETAADVRKWPCWKRNVQCPGDGCPNCKKCPHCNGRGYNPENTP